MFAKFLNFDEMITPRFIKILYWISIGLSTLFGLIIVGRGIFSSYGGGGMAVIVGLATIVLCPLAIRIWCEYVIVLFEIHKNLVEIKKKTGKLTS
jgi:membrane protein implicated in regulation of membrane protease activity